MYGELRWTCRLPYCGWSNTTKLETADRQPRDLFCGHCGRAQNAMAVLRNGQAPFLDDMNEITPSKLIYSPLTESDVELP